MNIGIDLGTTNTVVSYINEFDEWKLLEFENGDRDNNCLLPSCLCVTDSEIKIGQSALFERPVNGDDFLCDTKYYMGDDSKRFDRGGISFTAKKAAESILGEVMRELKRQFPEEKSFNAFVTVPARFLEGARRHTREALIKAGFVDNGEKRSLTDEPVAAAVAYGSKLSNTSTILVVDFGGGTFDLSLVQTGAVAKMNGMYNLSVKSWGGDLHLGGNDIDKLLIEKMINKFVSDGGRRFDPYSIDHEPDELRAVAVISAQPIEIKKQLYGDFSSPASILIPELLDGVDLDFEITPQEYEEMLGSISLRYQKSIEETFARTDIKESSVDKVLIVGGMAHEPCLRKVLLSFFHDESKLVIPKDSLYLVSKGAAMWNSRAQMHIENKVYSSIGILINNGQDVFNIVKEGELIGENGKSFSGKPNLGGADATVTRIKIVEYTGKFVPGNYSLIKNIAVPLSRKKQRISLFGKSSRGIGIEIIMNADKLFTIVIKQQGEADRVVDLRLGG